MLVSRSNADSVCKVDKSSISIKNLCSMTYEKASVGFVDDKITLSTCPILVGFWPVVLGQF